MGEPTMPEAVATKDDITRIEVALDKLRTAVERLILIEERQSAQGQRLGALEQRVAALEANINVLDRKVESWINRGIGAWALALLGWTLFRFFIGAK